MIQCLHVHVLYVIYIYSLQIHITYVYMYVYSYSDVCSCMYDILVQVTTREVETALVQSDHMLADNHYATTSLRELAWNMRELLEDFTARIEERERTLHEAADFFRAAEKVRTCQTHVHGESRIQHIHTSIYTY